MEKMAENNGLVDQECLILNWKTVAKATEYWSNFLPGVSRVTADDIVKYTGINQDSMQYKQVLLALIQSMGKKVTQEQYNKFMYSLTEQIMNCEELEVQHLSGGDYLQIGARYSYDTPPQVEKALEAAGLALPKGSFPFKAEMRIYQDGHITINDDEEIFTAADAQSDFAFDL